MKLQELTESTIIHPHDTWALLYLLQNESVVQLHSHTREKSDYVYVNVYPPMYTFWKNLNSTKLKLMGYGPEDNTVAADAISPNLISAWRDSRGSSEEKIHELVLNLEEISSSIEYIDVFHIDKEKTLIHILYIIKRNADSNLTDVMRGVRDLKTLVKWPELDAIEKSLKSSVKESKEEPGITVWDNKKHRHIIIPFKNKSEILTFILRVMKKYPGDDETEGMIKSWITSARYHGYDYPEFKTIEKSLRS